MSQPVPTPDPHALWRGRVLPAAGLVARRDAPWDALTIAVAAFIFVSVGRVHQLFTVLEPLRLALTTGGFAIAFYLAAPTGPRRLALLRGPTTTCVLGLLLWVALSVPGALWQGGSFELLTDDFIKTVAMYLLMVAAVRRFRDVERFAFAYLAAAAILAAVAVQRSDPGQTGGRLGGLYYYDPNDFATLAVTALPLGVYFTVAQRRLWLRLLAGLAIVPLVVGFVRSESRGGFLALIAVVAFFAVRHRTIPVRWRIGGVAAAALLFAGLTGGSYWQRMQTILKSNEDYNVTSYTGRWQVWKRGIGYMLSNPVFGVGAGNFSTAEGRLSPLAAPLRARGIGLKWSASHNSFVQIGAELGIPGLLLFAGFIFSVFRALGRVERMTSAAPPTAEARAPPQLAQTLMASMVGFVVGGFFLSLAYYSMPYTLAALAAALWKVTRLAAPLPVTAVAPAARGALRPLPGWLPPLEGQR
jgi:O-antigen ligase